MVEKCWRCGKEVEVYCEPIKRIFCTECEQKEKEDEEKLLSDYGILKDKIMLKNAIRIMERSSYCYMYDFQDIIQEITELIEKKEVTFLSAHEIVAAIILGDLSYEFKVNYSILSYRVDFYIPELKICLEIDGHQHKYNAMRDSGRDIDIRNKLGADWEVIRIPTVYIEKNPTKIVEAALELKKQRQEYRKKNGGMLPYGYSERENEHYREVTKMRKPKGDNPIIDELDGYLRY